MNIILASNNKNKLREIRAMLEPKGINLLSLDDCGIHIDIKETGKTYLENAMIKAKAVYELTEIPCIADDSGLEVDYLNGEPAVYSHRYAGENANDHDRCQLILSKLDGVPTSLRGAKYKCTMCYVNDYDSGIATCGTVMGHIGFNERGTNGFGYDSIFIYENRSFAELLLTEKNRVSHRSIALKKLMERIYEVKNYE